MKNRAIHKATHAPKLQTHYAPPTQNEYKTKPAVRAEWKPSAYSKQLYDSCFKGW